MKRYLVTGATGFLGRRLISVLTSRGHTVVALSRGTRGALALARVTTVYGNVLDIDVVRQAMAGCDGVFHCAGKVSRDPRDAEMLFQVHVHGTRAVLSAARAAGVRRVVVASTSGTVAISEDGKRPSSEDDPTPLALIQRFPYYRAKLYAEQEAFLHNRDGLEVVCVNPSLLLGPGDVFGSSTGEIRLFLEQAIPAVPAGGLSYVDVRDAADAMLSAMERGRPGRRYLLGASNVTVRDFFARLERVTGVPAPRVVMPRSQTLARAVTSLFGRAITFIGGESPLDPVSVEMGQLFWYVNASCAEREIGFVARDPIETLADTVRDLRALTLDAGQQVGVA